MSEDLVIVLTTSSVPEGEIAKSLLEDEGIPVLLKGGAEGPYPMGPVDLLVAPEFEARARQILEQTPGSATAADSLGESPPG